MENARLGFFARLWLAIWLPWKILFNSLFAAQVQELARADKARKALLQGEAVDLTEAALADLAVREARAGRAEAPATAGGTAGDTERLGLSEAAPAPEEAPPAPRKVESARVDPASALQLLSVLQRDGRFVDFLQEDVASYSDAEIGAAARVVHEGCKKALTQYVVLEPVRGEAEGAPIEVPAGFDPSTLRLTGNVVGRPPFKGRLAHHGWRAAEVKLPAPAEGTDTAVVAPAEVEL